MNNKIKKVIVFLFLSLSVFSDSWHKGQNGEGNCGPACVSMAIQFQTGKDVSVKKVREFIGETEPAGSTSIDQLLISLRHFGVKRSVLKIQNLRSLELAMDRGSVVILLILPSKISIGEFQRNYYHDGKFGHYVVAKGMKNEYLIVNDPMPNGEDRLYKKTEIMKSLIASIGIEVFKGK